MREHLGPLTTCLLAMLFVCAACSESDAPVVSGVSLELAEHRANIVSDLRYALTLSIPASVEDDIRGDVVIDFVLRDAGQPLQLDFRENGDRIESVTVNGEASDYRFLNEHIVVPAATLVVGENSIQVEFIAGSTSLNRNPEYLYTLFVPDRARTAFPLFDQPDLKARYDLTLRIPADWTAMANGPIETDSVADNRREIRFGTTREIPSYLFSFVAGKFESIERRVGGRSMTMLHRETDQEKVLRNVDEIFSLHASALDWLEEYTGIDYPFQKFGFALIPAFQYGGMEHVGAIQYRSSSLFLEEAPSQTELLGRAGLIAHETAHMWFGNLVTMRWFNDVWTKEVFANFMAAKIVNPGFPGVNHDLNFLTRHFPRAYSVDRTPGANAIRQFLPNLNEAGQMYGAIIYNKAPIMMRQLEAIVGEDGFRDGIRDYLQTFSYGNATWPALIDILDARSDEDLTRWSQVWVETPGRPHFARSGGRLEEQDPAGSGRRWRQSVTNATLDNGAIRFSSGVDGVTVFNADGRAYGLFPASLISIDRYQQLDEVARASYLLNVFEQMLETAEPSPAEFIATLDEIIGAEKNQLVLNLAFGQLRNTFWRLLDETQRSEVAQRIEDTIWQALLASYAPDRRRFLFLEYAGIATTPAALDRVYRLWSGNASIENLPLSENDLIAMMHGLAIKLPESATAIVGLQRERTDNPDNLRKLSFIMPSLSPDVDARDTFFATLANEKNRETERWVLDALANLHHPLRVGESVRYIAPSLALLQEIQVTGDIFFPKSWLDATLGNHYSDAALQSVNDFLAANPDYNAQLTMKIRQSADMLSRANRIRRSTIGDDSQ